MNRIFMWLPVPCKRPFYDQARYLGDPDFVKVPIKTLISKNYLKELQGRINFDNARKRRRI